MLRARLRKSKCSRSRNPKLERTCPKVASDLMEWERRECEYQNLRAEEEKLVLQGP